MPLISMVRAVIYSMVLSDTSLLVTDEFGNPVTSNLTDYLIPSAAELPSYELVPMETPTPLGRLQIDPGGKLLLQGREFVIESGRLAYSGSWNLFAFEKE